MYEVPQYTQSPIEKAIDDMMRKSTRHRWIEAGIVLQLEEHISNFSVDIKTRGITCEKPLHRIIGYDETTTVSRRFSNGPYQIRASINVKDGDYMLQATIQQPGSEGGVLLPEQIGIRCIFKNDIERLVEPRMPGLFHLTTDEVISPFTVTIYRIPHSNL